MNYFDQTPCFKQKTIIPVLQINRLDDALPLASALIEGGLNCLEITLRSPVALEASAAIIKEFPDSQIGIGTILTLDQLDQTIGIGADFGVSPGMDSVLARAIGATKLPFLPGVATVSEMMQAQAAGFQYLKLFPANLVGGAAMLKAINPLFPTLKFCPTGGVNLDNLDAYLTLPNVFAVGGSWLSPPDLVKAQDWQAIKKLASQASSHLLES
ncbi:MAG: bifunctional 4-hydroxy-2-oxoglutarate aldolase/2-dehydro-3-deoxy-phosphogluconate aldolase [Alphaproteobacteria bacterium]